MKSKLVAIVVLATAFAATPVWAGVHGGQVQQATPDKKHKGPHPSKWDITLTIQFGVGGTSGPCTGGAGNADVCVSGDCTCYTATGFAKGTAGKGDVILYESFDNLNVFVSPGESDCGAVFGDIEIAGTKDDESISFVGADCSSNIIVDILTGGCQLTDSSKFSESGLGFCSGNINDAFPTTFNITGLAE